MSEITDEELEQQRPTEDAPESEWKKYAQTWEKRAKANAKAGVNADELAELRAKAQKADEFEEANRTELEKAQARAEAAEAKIAERDKTDAANKLAKEVAEAKGLADPSVLAGSTREDLEAHADRILALLPEKRKAASDGTGGARGDDIDEEEADAKTIASNIRL